MSRTDTLTFLSWLFKGKNLVPDAFLIYSRIVNNANPFTNKQQPFKVNQYFLITYTSLQLSLKSHYTNLECFLSKISFN